MNAISNFTFHESHNVRIIDINGELWFVASDIASALDYRMASDMTRFLDDDERGTHNLRIRSESGIEQDRQVTIINESGLYSAILKSRKPEAKQFKKWVTSEVLPSIRKTGKYERPSVKDDKDYLTNKDMDVLKKLVWRCCDYVQVKDRPFEKFSYAIWECLRQVTGVKSTEKFEAKHLPIIAKEMHRILSVLEMYLKRANRTEAKIIKLMLRQRINTESITDECMRELSFTDEQIHNELLHIESLPLSFECRQLIR